MYHFILFGRCANKKMYVLLYGVTGCILGATYAYSNATLTTLEKRYRIPSRNTGIISTGNDISSVFASSILSYYGGKSHRPRWMAMGKEILFGGWWAVVVIQPIIVWVWPIDEEYCSLL